MRLRFPKLLHAVALTPYGLAKASGGRLSLSAAYWLHRSRGRFGFIGSPTLDALCEVLDVSPVELSDQGEPKRRR